MKKNEDFYLMDRDLSKSCGFFSFRRLNFSLNHFGTMDNGQWTMDNGQWTMDNGQWTMDHGRDKW
jgi:hypothetical protein